MAFFQGIHLFFSFFFPETVPCSESECFFQHKLNHRSPYSSHDSLNLICMRVWMTGFIPYFLFSLAPLRTTYFTTSMSPFFLICWIQINSLSFQGSLIICLHFCMEGEVFQVVRALTVSQLSLLLSTALWHNFGQVCAGNIFNSLAGLHVVCATFFLRQKDL